MLTFDQAQSLRVGTILHHTTRKNADGTPLRARVYGRIKIWKRSGEWRLPMKHGLHNHFYIGDRDTWPTADDCADPGMWTVA